MNNRRDSKTPIDAVNDAIGALSDLLHSLRTHSKEAARDAKAKTREAGRAAVTAGRRTVKAGKNVVRRAESTGERILGKAAKVWHDITDPAASDAEVVPVVVTRKRAPRRVAK